MDITHLVDSLRDDLVRAADAGGPEVRGAAERLLPALEPALRLTLMDALSQAAADVSAALPGVSVSVRLNGREPVMVVEGAPDAATAGRSEPPEPPEPTEADEDEGVARITLRLPEGLKTRAETLAARRGQSLNTWLVAAARAAASDDDDFPGHGHGRRHGLRGRHIKGWAR
jgi:hypothetical protein